MGQGWCLRWRRECASWPVITFNLCHPRETQRPRRAPHRVDSELLACRPTRRRTSGPGAPGAGLEGWGCISLGLPGPSCDPTSPLAPTDVKATLIPSGAAVGAGTCPPAEAGGGGRWHVQLPLPLPSRRGRLPWERQADGGLVLPDHTLALPPRLPARAQPPSFLSEDRGSSQPSLLPPCPPPGSAEGPLWGRGPGDWGQGPGSGVPVPVGGRPLCTEVGELVVGSLRHTGRGTEEKWALRLLGSAPRAGAESPWEAPQPCEQSPNLKPAPPCRCLCAYLIFKLKKQLKELGDCAALERA